MATDKEIKMLLQNLDENINIDLQNTENDSQNIWAKSSRDFASTCNKGNR